MELFRYGSFHGGIWRTGYALDSTSVVCVLAYLSTNHWFSVSAGMGLFTSFMYYVVTGEIGGAGATCGDSIIWPGTAGAYIISDILPGIGAIHTQSFWLASNQVNGVAVTEVCLNGKEFEKFHLNVASFDNLAVGTSKIPVFP